jgi:hypothetical protein
MHHCFISAFIYGLTYFPDEGGANMRCLVCMEANMETAMHIYIFTAQFNPCPYSDTVQAQFYRPM